MTTDSMAKYANHRATEACCEVRKNTPNLVMVSDPRLVAYETFTLTAELALVLIVDAKALLPPPLHPHTTTTTPNTTGFYCKV